MAIVADMTRNDCLYMAKLAHEAQRYDETAKFMDKLVLCSSSAAGDLTVEERKLLSGAYKNVIGTLRDALQSASPLENQKNKDDDTTLINEYKSKIESELSDICSRILNVLDDQLLPSATTTESKAFYLKMKGDYHRYLAEFKVGEEKKRAEEEAMLAYSDAEEIARGDFDSMHPMRLGVALNFSVFYHDILGDTERACSLAREAFEEAMDELSDSGKKFCEDSKHIMELLRENFELWTLDY